MKNVDRRKRDSPRGALPRWSRPDESDNGAAGQAFTAVYQFKCCVCDDYSSVAAQRGHFVRLLRFAQPAPLHRLVESMPMQTSQHGRNHDIETAAERLIRRITCDLGDRVIPFRNDAVPINRDCRPLHFARPLQSVHIVITGGSGGGFT